MFVDIYYTPKADNPKTNSHKGVVEKFSVFEVDAKDAVARFPDEYSMTPPKGSVKLVDRSEQPVDVKPELLTSLEGAAPAPTAVVNQGTPDPFGKPK